MSDKIKDQFFLFFTLNFHCYMNQHPRNLKDPLSGTMEIYLNNNTVNIHYIVNINILLFK